MLNEGLQDYMAQGKQDKDKAVFFISLIQTFYSLKENENVDSIYLFLNEKLEIYIFVKDDDDMDVQEYVIGKITNWEQEQLYFPEVFIRTSGEEINELPRGAVRVW